MATVNFIRNSKQSAGSLSGVKRYVEQGKKTRLEDGAKLVSGQNCSPQFADREFIATRNSHRKDSARWFYHYTQSFSPEENIDGRQAHEVAKEFAARAWPDSEVLIATHIDAEHIHSHFIVNAVCWQTGKMLRQGPRTLEHLRKISDEICLSHGLSVLEPEPQKKQQGMSAREYRAALKGESWKFRLMNTIDECMKYAKTRDEFISLMRSEGYDVKWSDTRKAITYTTPGGKKCRDTKLHDAKYLKEVMEREFGIRAGLIAGGAETAEQVGGAAGTHSAGDASHRRGVGGVGGGPQSELSVDDGAREQRAPAVGPAGAVRCGNPAQEADAGGGIGQSDPGTGWEAEREAALFVAGHTAPEPGRPDAVLLPDVAGSLADDLVDLGWGLETLDGSAPVKDSTTIPGHTDRKQRAREREKKIALGHKPDDHEEQQTWQQTM